MIIIKSCYSWYNIYINNTMILTHLKQKDTTDIIKALHKTNTPYKLDLRG